MLNAPLPLVTMSWSRLLLLIFVLSFILSSIISLFFIEEFEEWNTDHHQPLYIAHSQLPPHPPHTKASTPSPSSYSSPPHYDRADNDSDSDEAALGVSLSHIFFASLEPDERLIDAMELRVKEAKAAQQKTRPAPTSPYSPSHLLLTNLTDRHFTHLTTIDSTPTPSFSLIVIEPSLIISGPEVSTIDFYIRPAPPFFLPSPPSLRHIVTDDWQLTSTTCTPGRVTHSTTTPDHSWLALSLIILQPPFDFSLSLLLIHDGHQLTLPLPGHQPVTALTFLSHNDSVAQLLVARHLDERRFRAWHVVEREDGLVVEEGEAGPMVGEMIGGVAGGAGDVVHMSYYKEGRNESVVLVEYDVHNNRQSPFAAHLYTFIPTEAQGEDGEERRELIDVNDTITQAPILREGEDGVNVTSVEELVDPAVLSTESFPSSWSSLWRLSSTFSRYRSTGSVHPSPASTLIASSSPSHHFVTFSSTPFLTTIDPSHHFFPIEIIHLHPSTLFTHIAISDTGGLIALIDHSNDIILLQRTHAVSTTSPSPMPAHSTAEGKSHWEVALELILPSTLKRLQVLAASVVTVQVTAETKSATRVGQAVEKEEEAVVRSRSSTERLYLRILFEGGVLSSFALDVTEPGGDGSSDSSASSLSTEEGDRRVGHQQSGRGVTGLDVEGVGEMLWLNWEFLIGLAVIVFSAVFSLQMNTISRALQPTAAR